jgi:hypothetical protein
LALFKESPKTIVNSPSSITAPKICILELKEIHFQSKEDSSCKQDKPSLSRSQETPKLPDFGHELVVASAPMVVYSARLEIVLFPLQATQPQTMGLIAWLETLKLEEIPLPLLQNLLSVEMDLLPISQIFTTSVWWMDSISPLKSPHFQVQMCKELADFLALLLLARLSIVPRFPLNFRSRIPMEMLSLVLAYVSQ